MAVDRLKGRRIVVTRPRDRADELVAALEAEGAEVVTFPAIEVVGPEDPRRLEAAAATLADFDWVVFTSVYGVSALAGASARATPPTPPEGPRAACVGPATADAAREAGWRVAVVPERATGAALAAALVAAGVGEGTRVLFPKAADAREELPAVLRAAGAAVEEVEAYRKQGPTGAAGPLRRALSEGTIDLLTFTSPSTVHNFSRFFGELRHAVPVVVIGPTTARAAVEAGLRVAAVASEHTTAGLVAAVVGVFSE